MSTGSGSVDRWIVRGEPALHGQPISRVADHGVGLPRRAADGLPRLDCGLRRNDEVGMTERGQRRLVFVEVVVVEEGFEGGLCFGG